MKLLFVHYVGKFPIVLVGLFCERSLQPWVFPVVQGLFCTYAKDMFCIVLVEIIPYVLGYKPKMQLP